VSRNVALMLCHVPFVICRDAPLRLTCAVCSMRACDILSFAMCMHRCGTQVVPCAAACRDLALRMCHVMCVVCRDAFMACRGTNCLFIMAVSDVPHGNWKLQKQTFWRTLMEQYSYKGISSHTGMCISKYPLLP